VKTEQFDLLQSVFVDSAGMVPYQILA